MSFIFLIRKVKERRGGVKKGRGRKRKRKRIMTMKVFLPECSIIIRKIDPEISPTLIEKYCCVVPSLVNKGKFSAGS